MNYVLSDLDLMQLQTEVLFIHDQHGRISRNNEPGSSPAPQLFLGMTRAGNIWRFRHDLPDHVVRALEPLLESLPVITDIHSNSFDAHVIHSALQTYTEVTEIWSGPAYYCPDDIRSPSSLVVITEGNKQLLQDGFVDLLSQLEARQPCLAVVEHGAAVAVCFSARISLHAAEAGVETLPAFRGREHASRTVAGWAAAIRNRRRLPLYSTSWDNLASQNVAKKLNLIPYGIDVSCT